MELYFSKIDNSIEISQKQWAVSLVRVNEHAEIVIEGFNPEGIYQLYICDFMPREKYYYDDYASLNMVISDKVYDATVRCMLKSGCHEKSLTKIAEEIKLHNKDNPDNKHPPLYIAADIQARPVDVQAAKALLKSIKEDQALALNGTLKFNIYGKNVHRIIKSHHHNCTTWAVEQLKKNNIMHLTNRNVCPSLLPAEAGNYTDQSKKHCVIS